MDLEGFDLIDQGLLPDEAPLSPSPSLSKALDSVDANWHAVSRQARWMDLIGDYAGREPFVVDGHSLIQLVIDDPLLALAKPNDPSFQILHAIHLLECTLKELIKRSAVFDVVFWDKNRHGVLMTGGDPFVVASRSLARRILFNHLCSMTCVRVHAFSDLSDPKWIDYRLIQKPMFVFINDGTGIRRSGDTHGDHRLLCHREFLFELLYSGLPLAFLQGAEFRESKILTFVCESKLSRQSAKVLPPLVQEQASQALLELEGEEEELYGSPHHADLHPRQPKLSEIDHVAIIRKMGRIFPPDGVDSTLFFAYIVHILLLNHLSAQDRARRLQPMGDRFQKYLTTHFLPEVFLTTEQAIAALNTTIDVDVRIFLSLVQFFANNPRVSLVEALGPDMAKTIQTNFSSFVVPISEFTHLAGDFLHIKSLSSSPPLRLLPFKNRVFDEELLPLHGVTPSNGSDVGSEISEEEDNEESASDKWDASSAEEDEEGSDDHPKPKTEVPVGSGFFDDGILYHDTQHWHNSKKSILPKHLGGESSSALTAWQRKRRLRADQQFMKTLHNQAATLTGALGAALQQIKIPSAGAASQRKLVHARPPPKGGAKGSTKGATKQSKADVIREQNISQKAKQRVTESSTWLSQRIVEMDAQRSASVLEKLFSDLERNPKLKEPLVAAELSLYKVHRLFLRWIGDPGRESPSVHDKYTVAILKCIRDIRAIGYVTDDIHKCVKGAVVVLGFSDYMDALTTAPNQEERQLSFQFVKLLKSKIKAPAHEFMHIQEHPVEWQLRLFGEYMDRSMDSQPDSRVTFMPDAWQREVLNAIDANMSLLVVAPTSAGKTFISYYAMEKVLRNSDEGVIVYVAPTKALVAQVAAEIYARFSKDLKGGSCWAIHTRDYRVHDSQNCQILVTVPEILAIMLLSPPLAKVWTPRVQYIILDEIHTIGQQEGGAVWEQILLLAPCPIIGLSATVGSPEQFNEWLSAVQKAGGFKHEFVHHPHRYSHLRKFFYNIHDDHTNEFESLAAHQTTDRMRFLHPISMLAFGTRSIPSDLALESSDTLSLYRALKVHGGLPSSTVERLDPTNFFPSDKLLQQKDVITFETALKECLAPMLASFDPRVSGSPLSNVIAKLEDDKLSRLPSKDINAQPDRMVFRRNLIYLVADLHAQGDLPAILFSFDRTDCEIMAQDLVDLLQAREDKWRKESPEWKRKLAQYEAWLSRGKERERMAARAAKHKEDPDEPRVETSEWQASFNPDEALPAFSFAGTRAYPISSLEEDAKDLKWTSTPAWAVQCLRRGIAVHHAGMNKRYRSLVESLFRRGFVRVIIATGTLALGINAPTKTSVFCGDSPYLTALMYRQCAGRAGRRGYDLLGKVVFYGLSMDRVQRLTLSRLPSLGANFPVTSTLILRLFNLLEGSSYAPAAVKSVQRLLRLPMISLGSEEGKHQLLHHLRFTIDYLRRARLLDEHGRPFNLFGIAAQLYYSEPSNLALVALIRNGIIHRICCQPSMIQAKRNFIILMSHLFGRRYLPSSYLNNEQVAVAIKKSSSVVILPPLPDHARRVLEQHNREILRIFTSFAVTYGTEHQNELGSDSRLPLSNKEVSGTPVTGKASAGQFYAMLRATAIQAVVRSLFVANSGHDDHFHTVPELARTARQGLNLHEHAIPSLSHIVSLMNESPGNFALNAYILDFFTHGQVRPLSEANAIRRGDIWFVLEEFSLTLMTVRGVLEQLVMRKARAMVDGDIDEDDEGEEKEGLAELNVGDEIGDGDYEDLGGKGSAKQFVPGAVRPKGVSEKDWRVLEVVYEASQDFITKFKAMWA